MKKLFECQYDSALTRRNARSLENSLRKLSAMIRWRDILPQITLPAGALIFRRIIDNKKSNIQPRLFSSCRVRHLIVGVDEMCFENLHECTVQGEMMHRQVSQDEFCIEAITDIRKFQYVAILSQRKVQTGNKHAALQ
jgi:hypothetical protein